MMVRPHLARRVLNVIAGSLPVVLLTRPIKRITGMLSYAATGNPQLLSEQRRRAMAGLGRLTPLPRWRRGRSHRVSDAQENPTDPVMPTEPARPNRPGRAAPNRPPPPDAATPHLSRSLG